MKQPPTKQAVLVAVKVDHSPPLTQETFFNMEDTKCSSRFLIEEVKAGGDIRLTMLKRPSYSIVIPRSHCLSLIYREDRQENTTESVGDTKQA